MLGHYGHHHPHLHHPLLQPSYTLSSSPYLPHSLELQPELINDEREADGPENFADAQDDDKDRQPVETSTSADDENQSTINLTTPPPHLPGYPSVHKPNASNPTKPIKLPSWWSLFTTHNAGSLNKNTSDRKKVSRPTKTLEPSQSTQETDSSEDRSEIGDDKSDDYEEENAE